MDREGVGSEAGLLTQWEEGQPAIVWHQPIGSGYSAVTIVGDRLYTMAADESAELVLCLAAATGETIWKIAVGPFVQAELGDGGPRSTPTVDDGVVFTATSQSTLLALDADDGSILWKRDLTELGKVPRFGYSTSPLVDQGVVIVEVGDAEQSPGIVALDRETGEERWSSLEGPAGYSSAVVAEIHGVRQYLMFRRAGQEMVALSTAGEVLWRFSTPEALAAIVMPIFVAPDRVFLSTSDDSFGGHMLRVEKQADGFSVEEIWSERLMRNHFNTSVVVEGHLYGFDNGTLRCFRADTGERCWAKRGFGKGSVVAADGLLFVLSDAGLVALVRASPAGYEELGRSQVMEGRSWTAPSIANGRLYLRDFDEIVSLDVRGDWQAKAQKGAP
jgi:outer membrane protein assembly factor BamB